MHHLCYINFNSIQFNLVQIVKKFQISIQFISISTCAPWSSRRRGMYEASQKWMTDIVYCLLSLLQHICLAGVKTEASQFSMATISVSLSRTTCNRPSLVKVPEPALGLILRHIQLCFCPTLSWRSISVKENLPADRDIFAPFFPWPKIVFVN